MPIPTLNAASGWWSTRRNAAGSRIPVGALERLSASTYTTDVSALLDALSPEQLDALVEFSSMLAKAAGTTTS
jgi:hypothetical protein